MIASLSPLFCGPLHSYADKLRLPGDSTAIDAAAFFQPEALGRFFDELQRQHGAGHRIAAVSIWSKWYISTFLVPVIAANLLLQRALPIALNQVNLVLSPNGRPQALQLRHDGEHARGDDGFQRFATLIDDHLTPLVSSLTAVCGGAPRLFWSNIGNTFEFAITRTELHPLATPGCAAVARQILRSRLRPDGGRNPLFEPVTYADADEDEHSRRRKICCVRYHLKGAGYCSSCPIEPARRIVVD
ncbi:siderophore-iron reductase FhuF [Pseudomonas putida]|uniref:siderophore-iron reductase FhuF n=1 Tax=Pseudomonas putida TaxID=303 RepID=UPI002DB60DFA|nr:siderophore-iron reductase FhuF [Pseudomonas putida]WRW01727.1 siderophore-iron reductase FhuF [Pseudomonas putida]